LLEKSLPLNSPILKEISKMEIRVGTIKSISKHPEVENLYVEQVDVGDSDTRTIVSGLGKYCTEDYLLNKKVIVLCNLKPRVIKGVESHGMLLCASNEDHTKVIYIYHCCIYNTSLQYFYTVYLYILLINNNILYITG
jgi:methionine--tRNA ligase beta chain